MLNIFAIDFIASMCDGVIFIAPTCWIFLRNNVTKSSATVIMEVVSVIAGMVQCVGKKGDVCAMLYSRVYGVQNW